jgi:5'-phosphate synthase pdxT subunit
MTTIGVLALQGAFIEHIKALQKLGVEAREVRLPSDLEGLDGLIIPGGESTTIVRLLDAFGLREPIRQMARAGQPIWGTCAGMILLAKDAGNLDRPPLGLVDIAVRRNAFGRQIDSFETDLNVEGLAGGPFHAVFIRAPVIERVDEGVHVLARTESGSPVAAREGHLLVTAFHPELTEDLRFHRYFIDMVEEARAATRGQQVPKAGHSASPPVSAGP